MLAWREMKPLEDAVELVHRAGEIAVDVDHGFPWRDREPQVAPWEEWIAIHRDRIWVLGAGSGRQQREGKGKTGSE